MFSYCVDPKTLEGLMWLSCYVTTAKHMSFYFSFLVVMCLLSLAAPLAMAFGFAVQLLQGPPLELFAP